MIICCRAKGGRRKRDGDDASGSCSSTERSRTLRRETSRAAWRVRHARLHGTPHLNGLPWSCHVHRVGQVGPFDPIIVELLLEHFVGVVAHNTRNVIVLNSVWKPLNSEQSGKYGFGASLSYSLVWAHTLDAPGKLPQVSHSPLGAT